MLRPQVIVVWKRAVEQLVWKTDSDLLRLLRRSLCRSAGRGSARCHSDGKTTHLTFASTRLGYSRALFPPSVPFAIQPAEYFWCFTYFHRFSSFIPLTIFHSQSYLSRNAGGAEEELCPVTQTKQVCAACDVGKCSTKCLWILQHSHMFTLWRCFTAARWIMEVCSFLLSLHFLSVFDRVCPECFLPISLMFGVSTIIKTTNEKVARFYFHDFSVVVHSVSSPQDYSD